MSTDESQRAQSRRDARSPELPPWLRARIDLTRIDAISELIQANGSPDACGIQLFSNDYLSFANDAAIVRAMLAATAESTDSLWMSSVFFAEDSLQRRLERRFAAYLRTEDCLIAQSGYCANLGLLQSIAAPGTNVYIDACAHASLWHGLLLSRATPRRFAHNDATALENAVRQNGSGIIVVDSVYSHDGSVCPLRDVVAISARFDCLLVVDESHSLGTHGPEGAGLIADLGLESQVHFRTASLAKAFVSRAGLVAGPEAACWLMRYSAGPAIFSSACMAQDLAGLECALECIARADARRRQLHENAAELRKRLSALGYGLASGSQIIALESGVEAETVRLRRYLESEGIYGSVFCAPVTRADESLVRLSVNARLTARELDRVVDVCTQARGQLRFDEWASTRRKQSQPTSIVA